MENNTTKWLRRSSVRRLKLIVQYAHIDVDSLHRCEFAGQQRAAAESWLRRMCRDGWLQAAPLDERRVYYRLTAKAVLSLKRHYKYRVSRAATRPLTPNRKLEKHALLLYCTAAGAPVRSPYRPSQDAARFPDIVKHIESGRADPLRHKLFYAEGRTVGFFVTDRGQSQLIPSKVRPKMFALFGWESFQKLITPPALRLTVATASESRQRELIADLGENPPPIPAEVIVIPELVSVMPPTKANGFPGSRERKYGKAT